VRHLVRRAGVSAIHLSRERARRLAVESDLRRVAEARRLAEARRMAGARIVDLIHCCGVRRFASEGSRGRTDDILPVALTESLAWHGVIHWDKQRVSSSDGVV
jgi:hypothetical protein